MGTEHWFLSCSEWRSSKYVRVICKIWIKGVTPREVHRLCHGDQVEPISATASWQKHSLHLLQPFRLLRNCSWNRLNPALACLEPVLQQPCQLWVCRAEHNGTVTAESARLGSRSSPVPALPHRTAATALAAWAAWLAKSFRGRSSA